MNKLEEFDKLAMENGTIVSPFVGNLKIKVNERPTGRKKTNHGTGEVIAETYLCESTPYARVLKTSDNLKRVMGLTSGARTMFNYIFMTIEPGKDYFRFNIDHYKQHAHVSSDNTFIKAKKELLDKGFLGVTGSYKTVFWINPNIFFPGNRANHYPEDKLDITPYKPKPAATQLNGNPPAHTPITE